MNLNKFIDLIRGAVRAESLDVVDENMYPPVVHNNHNTSEKADDYWESLKQALIEDPLEVRIVE